MKKLISAAFAAVLLFSLYACTPKDTDASDTINTVDAADTINTADASDTAGEQTLMYHPDENDDREQLTLETIKSLAAEKGEDLTWSDFAGYRSVETGSGLYILIYETDSDYQLWIGGVPGEKPMYIYLKSTADDDDRIDIRTEDIDAFIKGE